VKRDKIGVRSGFDPGLHRFAVLLAVCIFGLIVAGATVTSEDAGLSVPDWPTSFGSIYKIPPMVGGVKFEHTHRMIAELVGLLTILFCIATFRSDKRKWLQKLSLAAIAMVIAQGILGGITVLHFLPWYVSSAHAALGQTFFSIVVLMALYTGRSWTISATPLIVESATLSTRMLTILCIAILYIQLFFGAAFRHSGIGIAAHLLNALLTVGLVAWTTIRVLSRYGQVDSLRRPAATMTALLFVQLGLGFVAYLTRVVWGKDAVQPLFAMVFSTVAHVAVGALLLATAFVMEEQIGRIVVSGRDRVGARELSAV